MAPERRAHIFEDMHSNLWRRVVKVTGKWKPCLASDGFIGSRAKITNHCMQSNAAPRLGFVDICT